MTCVNSEMLVRVCNSIHYIQLRPPLPQLSTTRSDDAPHILILLLLLHQKQMEGDDGVKTVCWLSGVEGRGEFSHGTEVRHEMTN